MEGIKRHYMKGFYSRDKRLQFEERLRKEQERFEEDLKRAKIMKQKLTVETNNLREYVKYRHSKVLEAQKRLKELQKQERERLKQKDNKDKYINYLRGQRFTDKSSNESNICALDLEIRPKSKIPKPSVDKPLIKIDNTEESKIPKFNKQSDFLKDNLPWKKGDLLDSLDLSSTNMKKLFENRPKLCESPGHKEDKAEWLKENFRESINEWAPKKLNILPEIKPTKRVVPRKLQKIGIAEKIEELKEAKVIVKQMNQEEKPFQNKKIFVEDFQNNPLNDRYKISESDALSPKVTQIENQPEKLTVKLKEQKLEVEVKKKPSKFVKNIKAISDAKDDFLTNELQCVLDDEARLEASLARLDIKSLRMKHQSELSKLEAETKQLEESIKQTEDIQDETIQEEIKEPTINEEPQMPKPILPPSEVQVSINQSSIPDNVSIFSAHPYPRRRPSPDARSACSENVSKKSGYSNRDAHRPPVASHGPNTRLPHKIGAVYNEVAARSGRYSDKNPPPEYALPKVKSKELLSFRKPPPGPEYTTEVVKINPNIDIKALFND